MNIQFLSGLFIPAAFLVLPLVRKPEAGEGKWALGFASLLYAMYQIWVPFSDRLWGFQSFFGYTFSPDQGLDRHIALVYGLSFLSMGLGYLFAPIRFSTQTFPEIDSNRRFWIISMLQILIWGLVLFNVQASGIPLSGLFDPQNQSEKSILFSVSWAYPWMDLLANALPVCLFIQYRSAKGKQWFLFVLLLGFWLVFSLLGGWRYRIILFVLFIVLDAIRAGIWRRVWFWPVLAGFTLFLSFLTLNRMAIAKRQFHLLTFDLRQFNPELINQEFSNSRTFRASLEYMNRNGISHPGLAAWTELFFKKLNQEQKPVSRPWILEMTKAWIPPGWPWNPNPAVCQNEEMYLTFGWWGLLPFMVAFGIWLRFLDGKWQGSTAKAFQIVAIGLLFQWISRGFFLFQLQISLVCLLPFGVLVGLGPYLSRGRKKNPA